MGNESGEWIMHGMKWDNPDCIHSVDEAIKYINEFGFLLWGLTAMRLSAAGESELRRRPMKSCLRLQAGTI